MIHMKKFVYAGFFIWVLGLNASLSPAAAGEAGGASAPSPEGLYTSQVLPNGIVMVYRNFDPIARIQPQVFQEGWTGVPLHIETRDRRFDAMADFPGGGQAGFSSSATLSGSSLHLHYRFTPLKDAQVICVRAAAYLNYSDWIGAPYQTGLTTGNIPAEIQKGYFIAGSDKGDLHLGALQAHGLTLEIQGEGLYASFEDDRNWGTYLGLMLNHHEPITPWLWKAGEAKDFDFTLTLNRKFETAAAPEQVPPKGFAGYWMGAEHQNGLLIQKGAGGEFLMQYDDFVSGQYHQSLVGKTTVQGKDLKFQGKINNDPLQAFLHLNPDGSLTSAFDRDRPWGNQKGSLHFRRILNAMTPRMDEKGNPVTQYAYQAPATLSDGWQTGDLKASPLDPVLVEKGVGEILNQKFPHIQSLVVAQGGRLLVDEYFEGFGPGDLHQLQSATKSVLSILFGLAQDRGLLNVNDRLYDDFPAYRSKPGWTADKDHILLRHLLTMTSGYSCDDFTPATDCLSEMYRTQDWLDFMLTRPMNHEPGDHWAYCNGCMELLGALVAGKSGSSIPNFSRDLLFDPLGIQQWTWGMAGPNDVTEVCGSLQLRPRDLAKLGQLMLRKGKWNGKQVVSEQWVEESTKPQALTPKDPPRDFDYGYLWWQKEMPCRNGKVRVFYAAGRGGQYLYIVPELDLVCVLNGGNYDDFQNTALEEDFFRAYILGAFK